MTSWRIQEAMEGLLICAAKGMKVAERDRLPNASVVLQS
jgi:hypothetical protein